MKSNHPELNNREWLADQYDAGMTASEIAAAVGCESRTVIDWSCHHGLTANLPQQAQTESDVITREWLQRQVAKHDSLEAIAEGTAHTSHTVTRWAIRYGIDVPDGRETDDEISGLPDEGEWPDHAKTGHAWQDEAQLRRAYKEHLWSAADIGRFCGVNPSTIRSEMERKDIELRDQGTAITLRNMRDRGMSLAHRKSVVRGFGGDTDASDETVEWTRLTD